MRLTVVGCSGSYPGPDSPASCYLIEHDDGARTWRILLDLGNGALGVLHNHADPLAIDAVLISHLHPDHCIDMCGYHVLRKYHPRGAQPRIPVWGPAGTADRLARAYDLPIAPGMSGEFDFSEYDVTGAPIEIGPFSIEPFEVLHPVTAYALRVTCADRSLVYSGDTAACAGLDRAAAGADLFLCEASFRDVDDNPPDIHLTGVEAGATATRARVERMVLTHIPPWYDAEAMAAEARSSYAGPVDLASRAATYDI